jgi:predicted nucleic acid-binding protein
MSREIIIADTSCLIVLQRINALQLLQQLFGSVKITEEVRAEFGENLPDWIEIVKAESSENKIILDIALDKGEASSIAYCLEHRAESVLIIDERKGRKVAQQLGLKIIGTVGVLLKAKQKGVINSLKEKLEQLEKTDFRISAEIKEDILKRAGE